MKTAKTTLNMVIGYPLSHTQSPFLHNILYEKCGLDAVLLAFSNKDINALINAARTLSIGLIAVTMPFKESILNFIENDHCSEEVKALKAANTIIQREGKLYAYNTDVDGIAYALRKVSLTDKHVLVLGAGGAARALGYFLHKNSANIKWFNRALEKAEMLAQQFGGEVIAADIIDQPHFDVIINATPVGMAPDIDHNPLENYKFQPQHVVFDMIYNPRKTAFLKEAEKRGATIIDGLDMFIGQGIRQIALWSGKNIPEEHLHQINQLMRGEQL